MFFTERIQTKADLRTFPYRRQIELIQQGEPLPPEEIIRLLKVAEAYWLFDYHGDPTRPHALLTSGKHSDGYINCSEFFQYPAIQEVMAAQLAMQLAGRAGNAPYEIDCVASSPMAAITFGNDVARHLRTRFIFTEPDKEGNKKLSRFAVADEHVLLVEELITLATTLATQAELIRQAAGSRDDVLVSFVGVFFNRSNETRFRDMDLISVVHQPMPTWIPEECPLCQGGSSAIPPKKPHTNWLLLNRQ